MSAIQPQSIIDTLNQLPETESIKDKVLDPREAALYSKLATLTMSPDEASWNSQVDTYLQTNHPDWTGVNKADFKIRLKENLRQEVLPTVNITDPLKEQALYAMRAKLNILKEAMLNKNNKIGENGSENKAKFRPEKIDYPRVITIETSNKIAETTPFDRISLRSIIGCAAALTAATGGVLTLFEGDDEAIMDGVGLLTGSFFAGNFVRNELSGKGKLPTLETEKGRENLEAFIKKLDISVDKNYINKLFTAEKADDYLFFLGKSEFQRDIDPELSDLKNWNGEIKRLNREIFASIDFSKFKGTFDEMKDSWDSQASNDQKARWFDDFFTSAQKNDKDFASKINPQKGEYCEIVTKTPKIYNVWFEMLKYFDNNNVHSPQRAYALEEVGKYVDKEMSDDFLDLLTKFH